MNQAIYLDYMATTPVDTVVLAEMLPILAEMRWCANSGSINHTMGREVLSLIETKRSEIADIIGANPEELIFTSGATEANNLALLGAANFYQRQGRHLITVATEHKAVLNVFAALEKQGFDVTYLPTKSDGLLDFAVLETAIRPDTILVSVMQVNNEIGVIQDIDALADYLAKRGIIFHVDAAQGYGPLGVNLRTTKVSLMSFSAHKIYGPKGIGALFIRNKPRLQLQPILFGGGQEFGLRPGTLATHQIVGMAKAFALSESRRLTDQKYFLALREQFLAGISNLQNWQINGSMQHRINANLNLCVAGVDGSDLINNLHPLMISAQSACSASLGGASHVLTALGLSDFQARSSVRISFGRMTTPEEVTKSVAIFCQAIQQIRNK